MAFTSTRRFSRMLVRAKGVERVCSAALGLSGRKGVIQPGADADIILVDSNIGLKAVLLHGKRVTYP